MPKYTETHIDLQAEHVRLEHVKAKRLEAIDALSSSIPSVSDCAELKYLVSELLLDQRQLVVCEFAQMREQLAAQDDTDKRRKFQAWQGDQMEYLNNIQEHMRQWDVLSNIERTMCDTHSQRNAVNATMRLIKERIGNLISHLSFEISHKNADEIPF